MTLKTLTGLDPKTQYWTSRAVAWMDQFWDEPASLIYFADDLNRHSVRETIWYALGLLLRQGSGDVERARLAINGVLQYQFDEPGTIYHGTFYRYPQESHPPTNPTEWLDYDPNWREFIGTTLAIILDEYESLLPPDLIGAIDQALFKAAAGAFQRNVTARYTNIALMSAYLSDFVGDRLNVPEWRVRAKRLAAEIDQLFQANKTFEEYNSPTYYGVDLYALAQWRAYGLTDQLRQLGQAMEADLWRDIGHFYHAGLKNMCGPYDRSYGMDLRRYIGLVGLWLAGAVEPELAPLPNIDQPFDHQHDLCFMPCVAMVGVVVPPDVLAHLNHFIEPRQVTRTITINPQRLATAYLDRTYMVGGESTAASRNATGQFHPVTIHWRLPDGDIGWLRLICLAPVDATAEAGRLSIACHFDQVPRPEEDTVIFQIYAPNTDPATIQADCWHLPGLTITVKTTAAAPEVVPQADLFEIVYALPKDKAATLHTFHLKLEAVHDPG